MATWFFSKKALQNALGKHKDAACFGPVQTDSLPWIDAASDELSLEFLGSPRTVQSPKGFMLPASELLGSYGKTTIETASAAPETVLFAVRACELRARAYLDEVLLNGDFVDPAYRSRRENTTTIACDCVDCTETCFCTLVGGKPYADEGYDVNLTPVEDGYVAEIATEAGEKWLGSPEEYRLGEPTDEQRAERDKIRGAMVERLEKQNEAFKNTADDTTPAPLREMDDPAWQKFAADCVECGACTNICPTCHCFHLYDQTKGDDVFERIRAWDSCLLSTYHRMAGGVNMKMSPRPKLFNRLAQRILHKFVYSPQQYKKLGCVGCGRCVEACIGAIDIREVVTELAK